MPAGHVAKRYFPRFPDFFIEKQAVGSDLVSRAKPWNATRLQFRHWPSRAGHEVPALGDLLYPLGSGVCPIPNPNIVVWGVLSAAIFDLLKKLSTGSLALFN